MIPRNVSDVLTAEDAALFVQCASKWDSRRESNATRSIYFDGEAALKDFGISLPPQMRSISAALGWHGKGVRAVTDRSRFEGVVSASGSEDPFEMEQILADNQFRSEYPQAKVSSAVHGCSFLTVSMDSGQPMIHAVSADTGAGIWDTKRRLLKAFLEIVEIDEQKRPSLMVLYTPERAITVAIDQGKPVVVDVVRNPLGRVTVFALPYNPELRRPLGHSRISRASMYFADAALRTIVRAEVSAEFYSAPEYFLFGADVSGFAGDDKWTALMGRIKAWDYDSVAGEAAPTLHRFNGASPQPHTDQLRMWQALFADDQDLEVTFADSSNPSSADAIFAAKESLITVTEDANGRWDAAAVQALQTAVMLRDDIRELTPELRQLSIRSTDPRIVSPTGRADAYTKISSVDPVFATSRVGRSYAGLTQTQILELEAADRKASSESRLALLAEAAKGLRDGNGVSGGGVSAGESGSDTAGAVATTGLPV